MSWSDYFGEGEEEETVEVEFITGKLLKIRLPGDSIVKKIKQHRLQPTHENFVGVANEITIMLTEHLTHLLNDDTWLPLEVEGE